MILASEVAGVVVLGYAFLVVIMALPFWLEIRTPGTVMGPPTFVQWWNAQFVHGFLLAGVGAILLIGSVLIRRFWGKPAAMGRRSAHKALAALVLLALGLAAAAALANSLPPPQRTLSFSPSDFTLESSPGHIPYENYLVSGPFQAYAGESLFPLFNFTLTDNQTGALELWDPFASTWFTSPSALVNQNDRSMWAWGAVVPRDGPYILWIRYDYCPTPGTVPCNNYTGSVRGQLQISAPLAYEPWLAGFGLTSSAAMVAAVAQSAKGRRRTTS